MINSLIYRIPKPFGQRLIELFIRDDVVAVLVHFVHDLLYYLRAVLLFYLVATILFLVDSHLVSAEYLLQFAFVDCAIVVDVEHFEHFFDGLLIEVCLGVDCCLEEFVVVYCTVAVDVE